MAKHRYLACAVVLFMLASPVFAMKKPHRVRKLSTAVYLAAEFDAATTYHLLHNCGNRCYEGNPMVRPFARNPGVFAVLGASAYAVNYFAGKLKKQGHPRWAKALQVIAIGSHTGAGAYALGLEH